MYFRSRPVKHLVNLPFEFLYDLYKAWSSRYNPSGTLQGRNTFQKEIRNVAKCSTMWYPAPDRFRTKHMMDPRGASDNRF